MNPVKRILLKFGGRRKEVFVQETPTKEDPTQNPDNLDDENFTSDDLNTIRLGLLMCRENHINCNKTRGIYLPTRLVDVGSSHHDPRLVLHEEVKDQSYASLSHRWGKFKHQITTTINLANHMESISMDSLSDTFQRAIIITRGLGLRCLWIDSLCIIQDSNLDRERESVDRESFSRTQLSRLGI